MCGWLGLGYVSFKYVICAMHSCCSIESLSLRSDKAVNDNFGLKMGMGISKIVDNLNERLDKCNDGMHFG